MGHIWLQKAKNSSNCNSLCKRCKFWGGEQESGMSLHLLYRTDQQRNGCNSLKFLLFPN